MRTLKIKTTDQYDAYRNYYRVTLDDGTDLVVRHRHSEWEYILADLADWSDTSANKWHGLQWSGPEDVSQVAKSLASDQTEDKENPVLVESIWDIKVVPAGEDDQG